jgi:hypothetical protein
MSERISGLFAVREDAEQAVGALMDRRVDREEISLVTRGGDHIEGDEPAADTTMTATTPADARAGAGVGAGVGAALGLLGMVLLIVPGIGPVAAAGPIAAALAAGTAAGAAAGAIAGGVYGSLRDLGVDEGSARVYESGILAGSTLVSVRSEAMTTAEIEAILTKYGASEITVGLLPDPDPENVGILDEELSTPGTR